jgi:hypothetical protein
MGPLLPVLRNSTDPDFPYAALDKRMRLIDSDELYRKSGGFVLL